MLKAFDVVVVVYLASGDRAPVRTQTEISKALGVSQSSVHRSLVRLENSRLVRDGRPQREELRRFILHGVPFAYPAHLGGPARGVRTANEAAGWGPSPYRDHPVVWPCEAGSDTGLSLVPLHAGVPVLALRDSAFGQLMGLVEIARVGSKRELARVGRELKERWRIRI